MKRIGLGIVFCFLAISIAQAQSIGGGLTPPGGANTQCQYNNGGAFGGITGCTSNGSVVTLNTPIITGAVTGESLIAPSGGAKNDVNLGTSTNTGWYFPGSGQVAFSSGGVSKLFYDFTGAVPQFTLPSDALLAWCNTVASDCAAQDTYIGRGGAANTFQFGFTQGGAAAQTFQLAPTIGTNSTSGLWKFVDGGSTGTGLSGGYAFQVAPAGASSSTPNAWVNAFTIAGTGLIAVPRITSDSGHTTGTLCQDTTTHAIYTGSGTLGICLGTSSARFKTNITSIDVGLKQIMALEPVKYNLDIEHGDNSNKILYGFTAEQGGIVIPELMTKDSEGRPNTFDYLGVVPVLVKAVQELQAEVDKLKKQK